MKISALLCLAVSPLGCSFNASTHVHRTFGEGAANIHSQVRMRDGLARFRCVESATGECHYTVYPTACPVSPDPAATTVAACEGVPLARLTVARGDTREIAGLRDFRLCVRTDAALPDSACRTEGMRATH